MHDALSSYIPSVHMCTFVLYTPLDLQVMAHSHSASGWVPFLGAMYTPPADPDPGRFLSPGTNHSLLDLLFCLYLPVSDLTAYLLASFAHTFFFVGENQEAHRHLGAWWHLSDTHARLIQRKAECPSTE